MSRVLVVDDSAVSLKLAVFVLGGIGCQAHGVSSAALAFEELQRNKYDMILMDLYMPEMNGFEAAAFIQNGGAGGANSKLPIIAVSGTDEPEERKKSRSAGMIDFVPKPFTEVTIKPLLSKYCPDTSM